MRHQLLMLELRNSSRDIYEDINHCTLPSPLNPNVHISSKESRVCALEVSGSNASQDGVRI